MKQIKQTYIIKASIEKVWLALTDAEMAEKWGAGPAEVDAREGGTFSYWEGDIHGSFTKLIPNKLIEQAWYGHDNPERKYNATFHFRADSNDETTVELVFSGEIEDEQKDSSDWQDYYFSPIKKLLEK